MKIQVKITPNAKKSEYMGYDEENIFKFRIASQPIEGKANKALIQFLAKFLKVKKSDINILKGETSKLKLLDIPAHCLNTLKAKGTTR